MSDAFVTNFAGQWLYLRNLPSAGPVATVFPDFDDSLRQAFQRETELFFDSVVREDRGALELLTRELHVPERTARAALRHPEHQRQPLPARDVRPRHAVRGGLLGQGSILTVTSHPDRTSPVVRGKWILENILGTSPPPPPPNVPELKPTGEPGSGALDARAHGAASRRTRRARAATRSWIRSACRSKTSTAWAEARTLGESSAPIDASGVLPDGTTFVGPAGLKRGPARRSPISS